MVVGARARGVEQQVACRRWRGVGQGDVAFADQLQVSTIFTSVVRIRAIGALLAASLIACTVQRIPGTWRMVRKPHVDVGPAFFEHAPQLEAMTFHRSPRRRWR